MLHLHCTRTKIFRRQEGDREHVVQCARNQITNVPDWVKDDLGYKMGLKDKSIVDLTPPKPVAAAAPVVIVDEETGDEDEQVGVEGNAGNDGDGEPTEVDDKKSEYQEEESSAQKPKDSKDSKAKRSNVPKGLQGGSTVIKTR